MRKLTVFLGVVAALTVPLAASSATKSVRITSTRFTPLSITITTGDRLVWTNTDSKRHQVVADGGTFASPILDPHKTYSFTFKQPGTFPYHDGLYPGRKAKVVVEKAPVPLTISLASSERVVRYGKETVLSGSISTKRASQTITIFAQPFGGSSFTQLTTVLTDAAGAWSLTVKPTIETRYLARFGDAASAQVLVQVRPRVRLLPLSRTRLRARVIAAQSFSGHWLVLQRLTPAGWIAVRVLRLGPSSSRVFRVPNRSGKYRLYLNRRQAGDGYLPSWSGTQRVVRRSSTAHHHR